ncbi:equilibrative nucleobase transporter 1-like [Oppia nitens]|uniref:equilibrative nucleobase transporter 1-like n=1 Tax=Oppia nitens TaxID=1686743 RepID=UPI0023DBB9FF|nr:equilibrative nucleobase transporter 1-like [Oppia nitens]
MSTPVWKKRLILLLGLIENLVFSGTIFGWSAMNYMLKSERIYLDVCDQQLPQFQYKNVKYFNNNNNNETEKAVIMKRNSDERSNRFMQTLNNLNKEFVNLLLIDEDNDYNNNNKTDNNNSNNSNNSNNNGSLLQQFEAYQVETTFSLIYKQTGCIAQDKVLNLVFTIGIFCMGLSAFIWGFLLDKWGLRVVRIIISCLLAFGSLFLCLTNRDRPHLIFPAIVLLCLGGVPLRIANMQFANLYPNRRSTIISLYSGAFCASAIIFVGLKYLYDIGFSYFSAVSLLFLYSLSMFVFTFLVLPADKIHEETADASDDDNNIKSDGKTKQKLSLFARNHMRSSLSFIAPVTLEKFTFISSSPMATRKLTNFSAINELNVNNIKNSDLNYFNNNTNSNNNINSKNHIYNINHYNNNDIKETPNKMSSVPEKVVTVADTSVPLKISLYSLAFNLHNWWFSWFITYMVLYVGSLNLWLQRVTTDLTIAGNFVKVYGVAQILALVLSPIAGLLLDWSVDKANKETDLFVRKLKRVRAGFWPLFATSLFVSVCLLCRFFDTESAIYTSIVFMTIFRAFMVAVATSYIRIRFNGQHFNRLLGIMSTSASIVSILQFPLFVWESQYPSSALWVNIFNCFCTAIAFINPLYLLITPLQTYLLRKEEELEAEAKYN